MDLRKNLFRRKINIGENTQLFCKARLEGARFLLLIYFRIKFYTCAAIQIYLSLCISYIALRLSERLTARLTPKGIDCPIQRIDGFIYIDHNTRSRVSRHPLDPIDIPLTMFAG